MRQDYPKLHKITQNMEKQNKTHSQEKKKIQSQPKINYMLKYKTRILK